jgi:hypothetical protein
MRARDLMGNTRAIDVSETDDRKRPPNSIGIQVCIRNLKFKTAFYKILLVQSMGLVIRGGVGFNSNLGKYPYSREWFCTSSFWFCTRRLLIGELGWGGGQIFHLIH